MKEMLEVERLAREVSEAYENDEIECCCGHCDMPHELTVDVDSDLLLRNLRLALVQLDLAREAR